MSLRVEGFHVPSTCGRYYVAFVLVPGEDGVSTPLVCQVVPKMLGKQLRESLDRYMKDLRQHFNGELSVSTSAGKKAFT